VSALRARPTEHTHIVLGGLGMARNYERRWAAFVLNQALGGGMASRLFQEIREQRGLVYSVYSYNGMYSDTGTFAVYAGTTPRKAEEVLQVTRDELDRALAEGLNDEELHRAKGHLAGATILALEDTGSRMSRLGKALTTGVPLLTLDQTLQAIEVVTAEDVMAAGRELLGGPWTLAMVGPVEELDATTFDRYIAPAA